MLFSIQKKWSKRKNLLLELRHRLILIKSLSLIQVDRMMNTWRMIFKTMLKTSKFQRRNWIQPIRFNLSKLIIDLMSKNKFSSTYKKYLQKSKKQNQDERRQLPHLQRKNQNNISMNKKLFPRRKSFNLQNSSLKSDLCQTMIERKVDRTLKIRCNDHLQNQSRNPIWNKAVLSRLIKTTFLKSRS